MVYLGYMLPTSKEYEEKVLYEAAMMEVSAEKMLEAMIDHWIKTQG